MKTRCGWVTDDPLYLAYHDQEWGVPVHDDRRLFEFLLLEGAQAGLSWLTILKKREHYRRAFAGFDPAKVAAYGEKEMERLQNDPGIIRNRQKINAAVKNARAYLKVQEEFGSFDRFIWQFVGGRPVQNCWEKSSQVPVTTSAAESMSRCLRERGFSFVGPVICYSFMQAVGMVNDHTTDCFRYGEIKAGTTGRR